MSAQRTSPHTSPLDVFLILRRHDEVLLASRDGTGHADGLWNLPSGKLEAGEHLVDGLRRETREEIGLRLSPHDPRLVTTVHHRSADGRSRVGFFFQVDHAPERHGEPINAEPHKCARIAWSPLDALPAATDGYTVAGVRGFLNREPLVLHGWSDVSTGIK
ncbi:MAG TPA: NUDIX domain-containing protein [Actinopolymorphaceae bacterium]